MQELEEVHRQISDLEATLRTPGSSPLISTKVKDVSIEQAHRAIVDCLKAMAEVLDKLAQTQKK